LAAAARRRSEFFVGKSRLLIGRHDFADHGAIPMDFKDLLNPKACRWPERGDQPFTKARDFETAAPPPEEQIMREVLMIEGFMRAGAALVDQATAERFRQNDLIYPAVYCYRHAIELWLKWLVTVYGPPVGVKLDDLDHDLWLLWGYFQKVWLACGASADGEAVVVVGQIVKQLHDWDKKGDMFRHAAGKKGSVRRFQYPNIDLGNLKDVMTGVANFFSGCDGWLSHVALA
jgi:hypothetical protein